MPTETVFLDASGWIALLNRTDRHHATCTDKWIELQRSKSRIFTTDWIIAETGNGLSKTSIRGVFPEAVRRLRDTRFATIVSVSEQLLDQSLELYASRPDKQWGLGTV